jgi:hypothetical protein
MDDVARGRSPGNPPRLRRRTAVVVRSDGKADVYAFDRTPEPVRRPIGKRVVVLLHAPADPRHVAVAPDEVLISRMDAEVVRTLAVQADRTGESETHPRAARALCDSVRLRLTQKTCRRTVRVRVDNEPDSLRRTCARAVAVEVGRECGHFAAGRRGEARDALSAGRELVHFVGPRSPEARSVSAGARGSDGYVAAGAGGNEGNEDSKRRISERQPHGRAFRAYVMMLVAGARSIEGQRGGTTRLVLRRTDEARLRRLPGALDPKPSVPAPCTVIAYGRLSCANRPFPSERF